MAGLMQKCERYEEMAEYAHAFAEQSTEELNAEERRLLLVAYKNVVGALRTALRATGRIEALERKRKKKANSKRAETYRHILEEEM